MSYEGDGNRALLLACGIDYLNLQALQATTNCHQSKKGESLSLSFSGIFVIPMAVLRINNTFN